MELNRAVAVAMAFGPQAGLDVADALTAEPSLKNYHLLPAVRGDLLLKLGRTDDARREFERAASLTRNARERELLKAAGRSGVTDDAAERCADDRMDLAHPHCTSSTGRTERPYGGYDARAEAEGG